MSVVELLRRWLGRRGQAGAGDGAPGRRQRDIDQAIDLHESGRLTEAEAIYQRILQRDPRNAQALHLSGVALHQRGEQRAALAAIDEAIAISPQTALYHFNRGNVLTALGETALAARSYATAAQQHSPHMPSWLNLGRARMRLNDFPRAAEALRRAFQLDPGVPGLRFELATALIASADRGAAGGLYGEAAGLLEQHWPEAPDPVGARLMLAHALEEQGSLSSAATHFRAVTEDMNTSLEARLRAHGSLANCCNRLGLMSEAVSHYRAVLELAAPGTPGLSDTGSALATGLAYDPGATPQSIRDAHVDWAQRFAPALPADIRARFAGTDCNPDRRLRVGYVSPDFRRHPVSALLAAVLEKHDPQQVEVFCYYNFHGADAVTARIRQAAHHWRDIIDRSDEQVSHTIRADGIDILVDLAGHTHRNRLPALALKPAPVMVEWLGYYCTTGVPAFDWAISDPWSSPPEQQAWFTERLIRLPHTRFCYEPYAFMPEVNELPALANDHITFGCLNNLSKLNAPVLYLWARVMERIPAARLIIQAQALDDVPNRERFANAASACGLPMDRVELRGFVALEKAALAYHGIDIALDPFPFCGGMTSLEALWMGVPVITLEQPLVAGRQTLSMLHNLGMQDCVAATADAYVDIATRLASDLDRLSDTRKQLRPRLAASPLMDYGGFARDLEAAYRDMWREFASPAFVAADR